MVAPVGTELPQPGKVAPAGPEPAPYVYDARNNRHWDPEHHHWHFGPPPSAESRLSRVVASPADSQDTATGARSGH